MGILMIMKRIGLFLLWIAATSIALGAKPGTVDDLAGRVFAVEDHWAGQELSFKKEGDSLVAIWRILGSGLPVISERSYPVKIMSRSQCRFSLELNGHSSEVKLNVDPDGKAKAYLDGIRIYVSERVPNKPAPANRSQPVGSETNRASAAAGSGR